MPEDIAIVGFDGLPASEKSNPKLTTIRQPVARTGARAVQILNALVRGDLAIPAVEIMPVELVVRESCGALAAAVAGTEESLATDSQPHPVTAHSNRDSSGRTDTVHPSMGRTRR